MKIKYLPSEDRRNLRLLRHTTDVELIASVLLSIFRRKYTLQALWEYRKWFLELPREQYEKYPALICGLIQIYVLSGELEQANAILALLPEESLYKKISRLMMPGLENQEAFELAKEIQSNGWTIDNMTLTAGRPFVLNGIWDFTPSFEDLQNNRESMLNTIDGLYHDGHEAIYDIMLAEALYQRDQCYDALVLVVSKIPFLKEKQDMRVLFAALTLEIFMLVSNGQASSTVPLMENLRKQIVSNELEEYIPNINALDAWASMYDGDYVRLVKWMREESPDEYGNFCMLDLFRYMIKMRAYIIQGKYMLVTVLANKLMPLCEAGKRYMDTCELHLLLAMSDHAAGRVEDALVHMEKALALAEQYRYDRLIADEGQRMLELLKLYQKQFGKAPYLERLIELTQKTAELHPRYMKSQLPERPALTPTELRVLRLLAEEYTNAQIASITDTTVDTAKQHCKHICRKLEVENRHQAVKRAIELGILEPAVVR